MISALVRLHLSLMILLGGLLLRAHEKAVGTFLGLQLLGQVLATDEPPIDWVVQGMVARGGVAFFVARPGAGKTLLAFNIVACILTGTPVFGALAVRRGAVAYIDLDMHRKAIAGMRAAAALRGLGLTDEKIAQLPLYIAAQRSSADLRDPIVLQAIIDELSAIPDLVFVAFDTFSDLHHGKEGSPDDMTDTVAGAVEIATRLGIGVLVLHHQRKNGGTELEDVRGASSITAKADTVFILKTEREDEDNPGTITLLQRKARLTEEARPRRLRLEADGDVDGNLRSYEFVTLESGSNRGRPATARAEAEEIKTRLLWEKPETPKPELVKRLVEAGVTRSVAYQVAGISYVQKVP